MLITFGHELRASCGLKCFASCLFFKEPRSRASRFVWIKIVVPKLLLTAQEASRASRFVWIKIHKSVGSRKQVVVTSFALRVD